MIRRPAKAGIEEPCVVDAKLASTRVIRHHLRRILRRHSDSLLGHQDVELIRHQGESRLLVKVHRLPEVEWIIIAALEIDAPRVVFGPPANQPTVAFQVHGEWQHPRLATYPQ